MRCHWILCLALLLAATSAAHARQPAQSSTGQHHRLDAPRPVPAHQPGPDRFAGPHARSAAHGPAAALPIAHHPPNNRAPAATRPARLFVDAPAAAARIAVHEPDDDARPPRGASLLELGLAAVGSGAGAYAGVAIMAPDRCGPMEASCGLGEVLKGAALGSIIGSAAGAHIGSRVAGTRASPIGNLLGAGGGLIAGAFAANALGSDNGSLVPLAAFTLGQGALTVLLGRALEPGRRPRVNADP